MIPFDEHIFSNGWERTTPTRKNTPHDFSGEISATNSEKNGASTGQKPLEPQDKAMEDQELEPLEKAIQTAHSNFFVEEERFVFFFCFRLWMVGYVWGNQKSD